MISDSQESLRVEIKKLVDNSLRTGKTDSLKVIKDENEVTL